MLALCLVSPHETIQAGMYVTRETFDKQLQFLRKKFSVISLSELALSFANASAPAKASGAGDSFFAD